MKSMLNEIEKNCRRNRSIERERRGDAWIGGRASESCSRGLKSCEKIQSFVLLFFSLSPPPSPFFSHRAHFLLELELPRRFSSIE